MNDEAAQHRQATAAARAAAMDNLRAGYALDHPDLKALERRANAYGPQVDDQITELQRAEAAGVMSPAMRVSLGHLEATRDAAQQLEQLQTNPDPIIRPRED